MNVFYLFFFCFVRNQYGVVRIVAGIRQDNLLSNFDNGTGIFPLQNIQTKRRGAHLESY